MTPITASPNPSATRQRPWLLATVASIFAAATLGTASLAGAQPASGTPPAPTATAPGQPGGQVWQQAETTLRQALQQIGPSGTVQPQAAQQARQALDQMRQAIGQAPAGAQRDAAAVRTLEREIGEAQQALADGADAARARTALQEVLDALPAARTAMTAGAAGAQTAQAGQPGTTTGAQVVVQQPAPTLQLVQPPPQVTVRQAEPLITVVIPQPEIILRQPPAQVTVQMPDPQVAVQQAQPQVRVTDTEPQVQVRQGAEAQVQVQRAQPQVRVQYAEGQPTIRYEQTGQPVVRYEQQQRTAQADMAAATGAPTPGAAPVQSGGGTAAQQTGLSPGAAAAGGVPLTSVQSLVGTNLVGANGRDAGEVENLLVDRNGMVRAAVVEWGGFLGIGARRAVVPIDQIRFGAPGERARMDLTREQLEALPRYEPNRVETYGRDQGWGEGVRLYR